VVTEHRTTTQVIRFALLGGLNTLITGILFVALASFIAPALAYTISFATGIAIAVGLTPVFVFRAPASRRSRFRYLLWYLVVYLVGLTFVSLFTDRWRLDSITTAVLTFLITAALGFTGARLLFGRTR